MKVIVNGKEEQIENLTSLNILCHQDGVTIDPAPDEEGVVLIDPTLTVALASTITQDEWVELNTSEEFQKVWKMIFDFEVPATLLDQGDGVKHVVGLYVALTSAIALGVTPWVRFPETYLHPSSQSGLADMFAYLAAKQEEQNDKASA